jgi:hypothetical protein
MKKPTGKKRRSLRTEEPIVFRGEWTDWPSWVLDVWWEQRVGGRCHDRYGYGKKAQMERPAIRDLAL